ncbi:hypothetical protein [Actinoplanes sp. NPDC051494]|uniref:hypothetical protein n=1 Tax=Actinoplanes sp. NPDC051494 TaxID=3363907 RepID=UPI00379ACFB6
MDMDRMVGFGGKQAWLAIRDGNPAEVLEALGLRDLGETPWREGIDMAHLSDDRVAITPPLAGARGETWVLAAGRFLQRPDVVVDVTALSKQLRTEVQLFETHRVTELHRWQRAADGTLIRAFGYVGQTGDVTSWFGDPDVAERAVGLPAGITRPEEQEPAESIDAFDAELAELLASESEDDDEVSVLVSEHDVLQVADAWSLDPTRLDGHPAPGPLRIGAAG